MLQVDIDAFARWLAKNYEPPYKLGKELDGLRWPIDEEQQTDIWKKRIMEFAKDTNVSDKWISVKDRLPERYERILTYDKYSGVKENWLLSSYPCVSWSCGFHVTHWMPMPSEPPKGE